MAGSTAGALPVSARIDDLIAAQGDWRGELLGRLREVIRATDPEIEEELKWSKPSNPSGVPTWSRDGILCTGEVYKDKVKLTFFEGAALSDPARLFNASLDASARRAIDLREGDELDDSSLTALVREAVERNAGEAATKAARRGR